MVTLRGRWPGGHTKAVKQRKAEAEALAPNWAQSGATVTISQGGYVIRRWEPEVNR